MIKGFQWLFKRPQQDLVTFITFIIGLLIISFVTANIKLGVNQWYWIIPLLVFLLILYKIIEEVIRYLFVKGNKKVNSGYFVLVIIVIAFINTLIQ
ncbi:MULTISPECIES: hypothetical protein [Heyndrickxia]|jgi:4-hydroxybenzoate polyprenyltransferase|uniref:hypothetical protein n=1 Tax=Heyndrickxia TaxID=2837504 RepID=UPI00071743FE|nr:hypothetical protein [Heyndrickxia oleronia]OJH17403.1 hypothetical protein BLX88_18270 [Bacillus obstructivus]MBU5212567.1 hypothetical protein [Heyndrickxia oleronia]MCI1592565.1 hypothetical protein [Heyndrickxia oleronia]MCI1612799.1 hypothetical protein [Heyndrickxia oleronia]MCI1743943.1 hypothetical protein [Heyndrickxia oleronia]